MQEFSLNRQPLGSHDEKREKRSSVNLVSSLFFLVTGDNKIISPLLK